MHKLNIYDDMSMNTVFFSNIALLLLMEYRTTVHPKKTVDLLNSL